MSAPGEPAGLRRRARFRGIELPPTIEILRIGTGIIWLTNLVFILDPANRYWSTFSQNALSYAPTTIGGPAIAQYVSAHPLFFSWLIALATTYLAVAFLLGLTTRLACLAGSFFSGMLFATQWGATFVFPGGTDVGEHPLFILIYLVLLAGQAGYSFSVDHVFQDAWARFRAARVPPSAARVPRPWTASIAPRTLLTYAVAGTLLSFGIGLGLIAALPIPSTSTGAASAEPVAYVNLSITINGTTGWPQYSPANFTVPTGIIEFTIVDNDSPSNWSACSCDVHGTVGGVEKVNGTPMSAVPSSNVAHTFSIAALGLNVLSPGGSVVQFEVNILGPGQYRWFCLAPCGAGADPYGTPPMGTPGYMTGVMTVT